jgi:shikimate dehydrogenase
VVDGLGMLLHQGRPGFAAWFGVAPQVTSELRQAMLATFTRSH